jgi:hypothetical protein
MQTTWTENGSKHIATVGRMQIGRITVMMAKTDSPFLAVSENGMAKHFSLLFHAKAWIEELYADIADAFENEQ